MELEKIRNYVLSGKSIEELVEKIDWQEFEETVAEFFSLNEFSVNQNFRFKTNKWHQIDIVATRGNLILCVDCKQWGRGRHKKTSLKYAVEKQEERVKEFFKLLKTKPSLKPKNENQKVYALIVTLLEEDIVIENDTFVVPLWKLNSFLVEIEKYLS